MRIRICILLIAIFLTASYRLVPLPIGDTVRGTLVAVVVSLLGLQRGGRVNVSFFKDVWPLFAIMFMALLVDILLGRIGSYLALVWVKFLSGVLIASAVYTLTFTEIQRVILTSIVLLALQLGLINLEPAYFTAMGRNLGIVDPFVTHGRALERVYYAYFNANAASYSIYYLVLALFAIGRALPTSRILNLLCISALVLLALLTGGRGWIFLFVSFIFVWALAFRSTAAAILGGIVSIGWVVFLPLYSAVIELVFLREESNIARLNALKEYLDLIQANPFFGIGIQSLREQIDLFGLKPSHNFFLEVVGMFGVLLGGMLLLYLIYKVVVRAATLPLGILGVFALAPGIFTNTLLTHWGFFPLLFPVLIKASVAIQKYKRSSKSSLRSTVHRQSDGFAKQGL